MPKKSEFVEYLIEMLQPLGSIRAKPMFGGWGFYADERFFAIVAGETFYVKVDDVSRGEFAARGLQPFRYHREEAKAVMDYYEPPSSAMDDRELLLEWAGKGIEAAMRAATKKSRPQKKK
jgi:DNA transformation protein